MRQKGVFYIIKVKNWSKYNSKHKPGQPSIFISKRFLDDAKVSSLSPVNRLLFLSCILAAAESGEGQCEVTPESLSRQSGVKLGSIESQLDLLQGLQLVTHQKNTPLIIIKDKVIKDKITKDKTIKVSTKKSKIKKPEIPQAAVAVAPNVQLVFDEQKKESGTPASRTVGYYCELFKERHGSAPVVRGKESGILKNLLKDISENELRRLLLAYFAMPNSNFIQKRHELGIFSVSIQAIKVFADSGKFMTMTAVRDTDREIQQRIEQQDGWENMDPERKAQFLSNFDDAPKVLEGE